MAQLERKVGEQALEIDFLKGYLQRIDEQRKGTQVSESRSVEVSITGKKAGQFSSAHGAFGLNVASSELSSTPLTVPVVARDEGVWSIPEQVELRARRSEGKTFRVADWTPESQDTAGATLRETAPSSPMVQT